MFLKDIENRPVKGMTKVAFRKLADAGHAIPEIMHLFRFKRNSTNHLVRFTEEVMRGPSPLPRGIRELIGAFISSRNQCCFCSCAHVAVASDYLGQEFVDEVINDFENSRLDAPHKELFRYLAKLAENPAGITATDISKLKKSGWSDEAIYDALTVASLFKFYNTWNNGSGVRTMRPSDYQHSSERILSLGYCMDFTFRSIMKIVWLARREIRWADLKRLLTFSGPRNAESKYTPTPAQKIATDGI
ncbi:MAG TPA: hypothetical protein VJ063_02355 [Verrucomicrobiae bacterium]|nr:hypothetical protein [Verrucomicrobiae bacterium]